MIDGKTNTGVIFKVKEKKAGSRSKTGSHKT
jgi:hypothetical protein